jgi:hypothetical protein
MEFERQDAVERSEVELDINRHCREATFSIFVPDIVSVVPGEAKAGETWKS